MNRWCPLPVLILICLFALPSRSPAPLIYRPGEGWTYESPGKGSKKASPRATHPPRGAPAPLIYRPGEGWTYESPGKEGKWQRSRAKDQLEVADQALEQKNFSVARRAAQRVVKQWPLSDYAPRAQYLVGRCYEASHYDEKAFKEYQKVLEKYPKIENYQEILQRQYDRS